MLHTWKPQLKRCYSLIEPSATSTSTRLFNWIFLSCQRDRHPLYACCVWLLVFCTFARFHGIWLGNKVARARIKVMNGFPRGPTTTSVLVTSSSIQKWIWPGLVENPSERLYFLGQYTSGKAKVLIKGCLQMRSEDSYEVAGWLLQKHIEGCKCMHHKTIELTCRET